MNQKVDPEQQRMAYESYVYRQQLGMIKQEMEKITLTMLDLTNASKTIESLEKNDSMVPIGGNAFIETKIASDKVIIPMGGGYLLKLEKERAKEEIEKRIDSTKKVLEKLQAEYENMNKKMIEIQKKLQAPGQ